MRRIFFVKDGHICWAVFETIQEGIDWCEEKGYRFLHAGIV